MGVQWSDVFEPNSSIKANRGDVWIKTLTFVSDKFHQNKITDTYAINIGLKNESHDCIERQFVDELKSGINNTFYSKYLNHNVNVHS